ncbi:protein toll [Caerostris darwini]|uniref:Protein toll n=1 Tax=Caerostris darwini TaxID=1538125 RepID=A0AAV4RLJ8_9ARAC|nr:protein toll [Caerostris darwini]
MEKNLQKSRYQLYGLDNCKSTILVLLVILLYYSVESESKDTGSSVEVSLPTQNCENDLPECKCADFGEVAGLTCLNMSDFEKFTHKLTDGTLFEVNTTYEITLSGNRVLPRGFLKGLIVFRLYIDDPDTEVLEEKAFEGVIRLRRFHVRISSISKVPDFRIIRDSVRNINIDNSRLTSLKGSNLQGLTLLETVSFVNNSIEYVAPDTFQGTEGVMIFDISHNKLTSLPPNLFERWSDLRKVVLSYNQLLHVDQLFLSTNPTFIYLDHNNLTDLDSVLHPRMHNIETLQLSSNPFRRVTENSFNGKVNNTRFLYLDHCLIREFDVRHYRTLHIMATLDLSYNLIEQVTNQSIQFGNSVELDFTGNQIKEFNAELPYNVKRVYLNKNLLTSLGRTLQFSQMTEVTMAYNRIQNLGSEDFRGVHGVQDLDLQGNVITSVERFTFTNIRKDLIYLDLSQNKIRILQGCVRYLSLLTSLNLTDNQIESFEEGEFQGLNELTDLYLHGNRITTLGNEVHGLVQLQYLVVSSNRIRTLLKEQIPEKLKYLYLADNPFHCDCKLLPFLEHLNSTDNPRTDVPLCTPPNDTSLAPPHSSCPAGCRCFCTHHAQRPFMSVDCSSLGLIELPCLFSAANRSSAAETNSTSMVISLPRHSENNPIFSESRPFVIQDEIAGLDLTNNSLQSMEEARLPERMRHLLLANNKFRLPPTALLYSLTELDKVTLSSNPWGCDCGVLGFKKWILSKSDIVQDTNTTMCGPDDPESPGLAGKTIWSLTDIDLCPENIGLYVSIAFVVVCFFLFMAGGKIAWTRYEMHVKVWLYSHGVTWVKEKDIDRDKQYDAFISFSHKDQNLVIMELIKGIETRDPNVKLFLHYKHFLPGEYIHLNIMRAVHLSKRTVLVLSKSFLESEWCLFEFKAAHVEALKDRVNRIIIIKMNDLPKDEELPEEIQVYLKSTTYLTWGDKYFWDTLLYTLPRSDSPPITPDLKHGPKFPIIKANPTA